MFSLFDYLFAVRLYIIAGCMDLCAVGTYLMRNKVTTARDNCYVCESGERFCLGRIVIFQVPRIQLTMMRQNIYCHVLSVTEHFEEGCLFFHCGNFYALITFG